MVKPLQAEGKTTPACEKTDMTGKEQIITIAKTKLADRPVVWKEAYTSRTLFLKKQFHEVVGPGSYFRFEGHDTDTSDEYFVVVGPAKVHSPKAEFFAGVRKLPADYAAAGPSFSDIRSAIEHAHETWGVEIPKGIRYYDARDLQRISDRVDKWKEEFKDQEHDEDYLQEWFESIKEEEETAMPVSEKFFYEQSDTYPFFKKVAMPTWLRHEQGFEWWSVDQVFSGQDEEFNRAVELQPSLLTAKDMLLKEKSHRQNQIADMYGPEYSTIESGLYGVWLVHRGDRGTYIVAVGPYCGNHFMQALDKFGVFTKKLNVATAEDIETEVTSLIQAYAEKYGVQLTREDFKLPPEGAMNPTIEVNNVGRQKVYGSPEWKRQILDRYGVQPGPGMTARLQSKYKEQTENWKRQLDEHYAVSQENGDAFKNMQPPPPSISLMRRRIGQQQNRSILRQNIKGPATLEQIEQYGFDSIQEAVDFLETTGMPGAPVGEIPTTTSEDLKAARIAKAAKDEAKGIKTEPVKVREIKEKPAEIEKEKPGIEEPQPEMSHSHGAGEEYKPSDIDMGDVFAGMSLTKMIKMAEELDSKGKHKEAEEIHIILRKHIPRANGWSIN